MTGDFEILQTKPSLNGIISDIYFDDDDNKDFDPDPSEQPSDENDINSILDTGWIDTFSRLHNINENQSREPMTDIGIYFVYVNKHSYIENILFEKQLLTLDPNNEFSILSKETILKLIQSKKISTPISKYKLADILSFVVDIEPQHIQDYTTKDITIDDSNKFLKVLPIFNDIHIEKSIFIFHNTNYLYFIFQEQELNSYNRTTLKSILKRTSTQSDSSNKNTKKVRIAVTPREQFNHKKGHRVTRKNII
jgi:hypothetical protein